MPDEVVRPALEVAVVLARADGERAPRALRPFLRFAHLPPAALTPVRRLLESDDDLRLRVAEVTTESVVGRLSWVFLTRPDGWMEELRSAASEERAVADAADERRTEVSAERRLAGANAARTRAEEEVARLRHELDDARKRISEERRARRRAETESGRWRTKGASLRTRARPLTRRRVRRSTPSAGTARCVRFGTRWPSSAARWRHMRPIPRHLRVRRARQGPRARRVARPSTCGPLEPP